MRNLDTLRQLTSRRPEQHGRPPITHYVNGHTVQEYGTPQGKKVRRVRRTLRGKGPKNHRGS